MKRENFDVKYIFDLLRKGKKNEGIELLYLHHYNKMYGIAFSVAKKETISQDIVQNVILKLLDLESDKFPVKNELSWLYTVIKNEAMNYYRKNKSTISIEKIELIQFQEVHINEFVDLDEYYSLIRDLNEKQKEIVTLKVLGGYTHKEIAEMLGKPIGTVQWVYNTALKKLKSILISLIGLMIVTLTGSIVSIIQYFKYLNVEEIIGTSENIELLLNLYLIGSVVFSIAMVISVASFLLIYIFSYKIPTKCNIKNV